jgi:putative membrane protein
MKGESIWSRGVKAYLGLVMFSLLGSAICNARHLDPAPIGRPVAFLTLFVGFYAAFTPIFKTDFERALKAFGAVFSWGFVCECAGLATGYPFGRYHYTQAWWPTVPLPVIGNFPIQLPFAWVLVVGTAYLSFAPRWPRQAVGLTAVAATLVDQLMEPTMTHSLSYWTWTDRGPLAGGTPVLNAVGWFIVSFVAALLLRGILGKDASANAKPGIILAAYLILVIGIGAISRI